MNAGVHPLAWTVGDVVRRLRDEQGISQETLAERAGVGLSTVKRIEAGANYRADNLTKIARALGASTKALHAETPIRASELVQKALDAGLEELRGARVDLAMDSIRVILRGQREGASAALPRKRSRE